MSNKNTVCDVLRRAHRIAIIGNAGSGKSTVARVLQSYLNLPLYHLDQYFWGPNWQQPNRDEYKIVHDELCNRERWIIEGTNLSLWDHRMNRAEVIVILKFSRMQCLWRIVKRTFAYYGKQTPSSASGCHEGISWKFVKFLMWVWNFQPKYEAKVTELLEVYGDSKTIYVLSSQQEIDAFLGKLKMC